MEDEMAEVNAIVNNSEEPTFDNTITAMQFTCELISTVQRAMKPVSGVSRDFGEVPDAVASMDHEPGLEALLENRGLISR
jgi:Zn-dependent oligopeptidase